MSKVLLVSMPFVSSKYPSLALSVLKPALWAAGIPCEVKYFNVLFRDFCKAPIEYETICQYMLMGEWVFGPQVFGPDWPTSQRGSEELLNSFLGVGKENVERKQQLKILTDFRDIAGAFIEECMKAVEWKDYDIIGFTSVFSQQIASLALAKRIKEEFPDKIIAFGGANCEGELGLIILEQFPWVDWVFSGDGDASFPAAIKSWRGGSSLKEIKGLAYRDMNHIVSQGSHQIHNLDELPFPDFDDYYNAIKDESQDIDGLISLEFSRGCWKGAKSQCAFCGLNGQGINYRSKTPARAMEEINYIVNRYSCLGVQATDNILPHEYFDNLLTQLESIGLKSFFVETRSNLKYHELMALKKAGAKKFQPGIESLDTELLKFIRKGVSMPTNLRFLKWCRELGLTPKWNFLHTFPGENPVAYERMLALIPLLQHLQPPEKIAPFILTRFSSIYNSPESWGIDSFKADHFYSCIYPFDEAVLNRLAYIFEYNMKDKTSANEAADYLTPVKNQLFDWQQLWQEGSPPILAYEKDSNQLMTVYDTRLISKERINKLNQMQSLILSYCNSSTAYDLITNKLSDALGSGYPGDKMVETELERLCSLGYLIVEENMYLSLVNQLEVMLENGQSPPLITLIYQTFK